MGLSPRALICLLSLGLAVASPAAAATGPGATDTPPPAAVTSEAVSQARAMIADGRRADALMLLSTHLQSHASDTDARVLYGLALSLLLAPAPHAAAGPNTAPGTAAPVELKPENVGDPIAEAHALIDDGRRADALLLLNIHLQWHSTDVDARMLYGAVLSWEGRYDEAREALTAVLARSPGYTDARTALVNVELWSGHPDRADALTRAEGIKESTEVLVARARALSALERPAEARRVVSQALAAEPGNEAALRLGRSLDDRLRRWTFSTSYASDWFSDGRIPWRETQTTISRQAPRVGSVIVRASHVERFGFSDNQLELEVYPKIRQGTYSFVGAGYAPAAALYPEYHLMADVYQSLGHGFEVSTGIRRLSFGSGVNIFVNTLSRYKGAWLFTGKSFFVPSETGGSQSYHLSVRRYLSDDESYIGVRYGHGFWREELRSIEDLQSLHSDGVSGEAHFLLGRRLSGSVSGSASWDQRLQQETLGQFEFSAGMGLRF